MSDEGPKVVICAFWSAHLSSLDFNVDHECTRCQRRTVISQDALDTFADEDGVEYLCACCVLKDERLSNEDTAAAPEFVRKRLAERVGEEVADRLVKMGTTNPLKAIALVMVAQHNAEQKGLWRDRPPPV